MLTVSEGVLVSGDENGEIKVFGTLRLISYLSNLCSLQIWDTRSWKAPFCFNENHDFISSMAVDDAKRTLLAASGDGTLCAFDLRQRRLDQRSDGNESELLSLAIVKVSNVCIKMCIYAYTPSTDIYSLASYPIPSLPHFQHH